MMKVRRLPRWMAGVALGGWVAAWQPLRAAPPIQTEAELSGFSVTGRYDEVVRLCSAFQDRYPGRVRCFKFGDTPEGRPMLALAASEDGVVTEAAARELHRPVILIQAGIHAGEIDGKDAGFWALREWLEAKQGPLSKVTVVFVPVFNVDGHERFGPNNRPNQIGPKEMGWRTTAQNLNLNRDYVKAEAPEMQAMLGLLAAWDPVVLVDTHVTDGAQFQHVISINVSPSHLALGAPLTPPWEKALREAGYKLEQDLAAGLTKDGHLPLTVYPTLVPPTEPGFDFAIVDGVSSPRFSHAYWSARQRIGILVETHSWKDYATRVRATHDLLVRLLALAEREASSWLAAAHAADVGAIDGAAGQQVALSYATAEHARAIEILGYAYRNEPVSEVSCQSRIVYDLSRKQVWKVQLRDTVRPGTSVRLPQGGYIVPAAHAGWVARKLALHAIDFEVLTEPVAAAEVEAFRAVETTFGCEGPRKRACATSPPSHAPRRGPPTSCEGRQTLAVKGSWQPERRPIAKGSLFVPIAQPRAMLVAHLLEPDAPDSLLKWGYFNAAFERVEYMEDYVAEDVARQMLATHPEIKEAFERRLKDPNFANDPAARLEFFYRRHPSWDDRFNLYPVFRARSRPAAAR